MMMPPGVKGRRSLALAHGMLAVLVAAGAAPCHAQSQDRERAQMLQMQQQLQRLQSDNAALLREKTQMQEQLKDLDRLKTEAAQTDKALAQSRVQAASSSREGAALRKELDTLREQSTLQLDQWKKALSDRDNQLQFLAQEKRRVDGANTLLEARLKLQTERADICETKHGQAMRFAGRVVDKYAQGRLRLCDPFVAMWKVHDREEIEALRDELYELRLDVPPVAPVSTGASAPQSVPSTAPAAALTAAPAPAASPPAAPATNN